MSEFPFHISNLLHKHFDGTATEAETAELQQWIASDLAHQALLDELQQKEALAAKLATFKMADTEKGWQKLTRQIPELRAFESAARQPVVHRIHFLRSWRMTGAAAVILLLAAATVVGLLYKGTRGQQHLLAPLVSNIRAGKSGAVLTLDDGSQIILDSLPNGLVATKGGSTVTLQNGQLNYTSRDAAAQGAIPLYNTITVPRGRQFQLVLPDGTQVWLNAESSLRFPVLFTGAARQVEMMGEAYFEVAKNAGMPFRVGINGHSEVEVLGTHFDINAYPDEAAERTTLLEGSVRVTSGVARLQLVPGEQAARFAAGTLQKLPVSNTDEIIAWKNGKFIFSGSSIQSVMRQLEKWYDIEVTYTDDLSKEEFVGALSRNIPLVEMLETLRKTGTVDFEIQGRQVTVKKLDTQ